MKAAVCYEYGQPLVVEDLSLDPPQRGEVKVRTAATAICHSDIHIVRGEWGGEPPFVAGHETSGVVDAIGEGVTLVEEGDRVVVSLLRACGHCSYCLTGSPNLCNGHFALRDESRLHNQRGEIVGQRIGVAGFAEYVVVDQSQLVRIPDDMSLETAALLACGVITGFGAAVNTGQVAPGSTVAVIGTGGVGLNAVQGAVISGARRVIAVDLLEDKLAAARRFGATHVVNATEQDAVEGVRALTGGAGPDYVLVTVGSSQAIAQGLEMVRRGGTMVIAGMPARDAVTPLHGFHFVSKAIRLLGSNMGSTRLQVDVPILIDHYQQGRLLLDELITGRYSLEQINEAIESTERGEALRNLVVF